MSFGAECLSAHGKLCNFLSCGLGKEGHIIPHLSEVIGEQDVGSPAGFCKGLAGSANRLRFPRQEIEIYQDQEALREGANENG